MEKKFDDLSQAYIAHSHILNWKYSLNLKEMLQLTTSAIPNTPGMDFR